MSTSIEEQIENHETRARLLRIVAKRFPDVTMAALWKDGPVVPVLTDSKHAARRRRVRGALPTRAPERPAGGATVGCGRDR